jgi:glycosyltransferase involved in cell wall biosynthesis
MFVDLMAPGTSPISSSFAEKGNATNLDKAMLMIPTLNEEEGIGQLLEEARGVGFTNIAVVDGYSSDRTRDIAKQAGVTVVLQEFGKGKGCGVRTGMKNFLEGTAGLFCMIDGDGTNVPSFLIPMMTLADAGKADVVLGSRTLGPREEGAMDLLSLASNLTVSFLLGAKFGRLFTDVQTGYWLFTRKAIERMYPQIQATGFEIELELFVKIMREGLRVREIPVGFRVREGSTKFSFMLRIRNLYYAFRFLVS